MQSVSYWKNLKKGDVVILKDQQTLEDLMQKGKFSVEGEDFLVKDIITLNIKDMNTSIFLFELESPTLIQKLYLMAWTMNYNENYDLRVYFEPDDFSPCNFSEAIDRDVDGKDLGTTTKSVKYSVLQMKGLVALQEAMKRIEELEAKVEALESKG